MPANILNLPQYRVLRVEETDHDYHLSASRNRLKWGMGYRTTLSGMDCQ